MQLTIDLPFLPGQAVMVQNYKSSRKPMERGVIEHVRAGFYYHPDDKAKENLIYGVSYDVLLDRKTPATSRNPWPRPLRLTVNDTQLEHLF